MFGVWCLVFSVWCYLGTYSSRCTCHLSLATCLLSCRGEIIGATNPEDAPEGSIRGQMLANWEGTEEDEGLDMDDNPNVGDNGVHASAGPIEGLKERTVWLGYEAIDDPFGEQLIAWTGGKAATIEPWLNDAEVEEAKNYELKGKMFDLTEDKDTPWAIQFCNNLALA